MKTQITELLKDILRQLGIRGIEPEVEIADDPRHGDYTTNVAMKLAKVLKKAPMEIALQVKEAIGHQLSAVRQEGHDQKITQKDQTLSPKSPQLSILQAIERVEALPPGFINFFLTEAKLISQLGKVLNEKEGYGKAQSLKPPKIALEHTSPNTIKTLHLGHVRNNVLGMAVGRLLEAVGNKVFYDAINNDRGIHVMKANWAYLQYGKWDQTIALRPPRGDWKELIHDWNEPAKKSPGLHDTEWRTPKNSKMKGDQFVDQFYVLGVKAEEKFSGAKEEMQEMLRAWEAKDPAVRALWANIRDWVFEGFQETYARLGSHHDVQWFESELYEEGKELVKEGLKKGAFRKLPDGAILTNLEDIGLSDSVAIRSDGTALYFAFDPVLTRYKRKRYDADLYIWDIGPEQTLYLKQLFAVCEKLGIGKRSDYFHLSYGFVYLKGKGKMSSRAGTVVAADDLLDDMHKKVLALIKRQSEFSPVEKEEIAERVGLAALKYGLLRVGRTTDIYFDIDESLSLEGDSGPYLLYTYARAKSVLRKAGSRLSLLSNLNGLRMNPEERAVAWLLFYFPEIVAEAAGELAPNTLCTYLFSLAQAFNLFYQKHSILGGDKREATSKKQEGEKGLSLITFRLSLAAATAQVIKNGLYLLGIETVERM